jgi:integrase
MRRKPTQRKTFSVKVVEKIPIPKGGRIHVYDTRGDLGLRIDANGRRTFFWFRSVNGAPVFRALGTFPASSIDEARNRARDLTAKLEKWRANNYEGPNPFDEPETTPTFGALVDAYVSKRIKNHATHPDQAARHVEWMMGKYLASWRGKKLATIQERDVRRLHREIGEAHGRVMADRIVQFIRRVFFWGINKEKLFAGPNPAKNIEFFGCPSRERFLSGDELAALFAAMKKEPNRDLVDFVNLALWTGARRGDVLSMRWRDINDNVWTVPLPKGGRPYTVPLTDEALVILRSRAFGQKESMPEFVFPSTGKSGHLVEVKRSWSQLLKRAGINDCRIHDLRRTHASWAAGLGTSLAVIGRVLGHKAGSSATAVYGRLDLQPIRAAMMSANAAMLGAAKKPMLKAVAHE